MGLSGAVSDGPPPASVSDQPTSESSSVSASAVDRPFFFVVRDIPTNSVLFVGRVLSP